MGLERHRAIIENARRGGSHLAVLLIVATYADHRGEWVTSQATLERYACLCRRQVKRILDDLVASGDLEVETHQGRGRLSRYRLLGGPGDLPPAAPLVPPPADAGVLYLAGRAAAGVTFLLSPADASVTWSGPLVPPFPQTPNPPLIPQKQQQETFGLPPAAGQGRQGELLPREESESASLASPRPLTGPQAGVFRVNLLLEEAAIPLPSPSQIGLWARKLGGIEPLLGLLRRLIAAGLANKRDPAAYVHRVVTERAAHPEPAPGPPQRAVNPLLTAGLDDSRREMGRLIAAKRGDW